MMTVKLKFKHCLKRHALNIDKQYLTTLFKLQTQRPTWAFTRHYHYVYLVCS